ncbi:CLUMA_CG002940, isoform A [Clunio marinus]|uniref:CLUMA_CG002940, isoform A n=1 Tax=Clunio marinus TaxID=568069 RepID=A0A1J1HML4_9DIPT|nr:CLUMA_CG002940, isoform A [Clunio marinus]
MKGSRRIASREETALAGIIIYADLKSEQNFLRGEIWALTKSEVCVCCYSIKPYGRLNSLTRLLNNRTSSK